MKVAMTNPKTGEVKEVKVGWSWILFLFSGFFGLPLFLRKLHVWGGIFLILWIVYIIAPSIMQNEEEALGLMILLNLVFSFVISQILAFVTTPNMKIYQLGTLSAKAITYLILGLVFYSISFIF